MDNYQKFISTSRYARWMEEEGRRESWEDTVNRICQFWIDRIINSDMEEKDKKELLEIIG